MLDTTLRDLRYGVRVLSNNPGFALAAVLTLAAGIGANTAIFSVVYGVLLRPLPYAQGSDLVVLHQKTATTEDLRFSVPEITDYREGNKTLASVVDEIEPQGGSGRVKTGGEEWRALATDARGIPAGVRVEIVSVDGATLRVKPV